MRREALTVRTDPRNSQMSDYVAAARAAWRAWAGELDRQRAGADREAQRWARIRAHSDAELMRFARKVGHEWADAELRRRGVVG